MSTDDGNLWNSISDGLTNLNIITITIYETNIYIGTSLHGVWRRPLAELTNIKENTSNSSIIVYPNPTKGKLTITNCEKIESLEIYNMLGKKIFTFKKEQDQISKEIDIFDQSRGVYFIKSYNGTTTHLQKIIKQ